MEAAAVPLGLETALWEGHAALAVGLTVERYLQINPPPADCAWGLQLQEWSRLMVSLGRRQLFDLGAGRLRSVGPFPPEDP